MRHKRVVEFSKVSEIAFKRTRLAFADGMSAVEDDQMIVAVER